MTTHVLNCWPVYFDAIKRGDKNFEVRRDDRGFERGDIVVLQKINSHTGDYVWDLDTGEFPPQLRRRITYILPGGKFGIEAGYVVLALAPEQAEAAE